METKVVRINAKKRFANVLIDLNVRFYYDYGVFYLLDTSDPAKIERYLMLNNAMRDVESISISENPLA